MTNRALSIDNFEMLAKSILAIDASMQIAATKAINQSLTLRNWMIGAYIVEYEQQGQDRAKYGERLLKNLEKRVNRSGLTVTLFQISRLFYRTYPQIISLITPKYATSHILEEGQKYATLSHRSISTQSLDAPASITQPLETSAVQQEAEVVFETPAEKLISHLSFSHIRELLTVDDPLARFFYETECIKGTWGVRELRRQISTNLHFRVALSTDKMKALESVHKNSEKLNTALQIRDPYLFEFIGLKAKEIVGESELEDALIEHLEEFLLEMGKGFCFEARQKRIIIDDEYFYADLIFYNRLLHCNVIIELKDDEFKHEHIGQLNAYVSYYAENEMQQGDNPPIGILLCTRKGKKMVEYALGTLDNNLFVSTYQLQLPNREDLEHFLINELKAQDNYTSHISD